MRIGQIVFIKDKNLPDVQTGIITQKEKEDNLHFWYEVLCNDGQNHVLPGYLLSSRHRQIRDCDEADKTSIKSHNLQQHSSKHSKNKLHYIHNGKQKLK